MDGLASAVLEKDKAEERANVFAEVAVAVLPEKIRTCPVYPLIFDFDKEIDNEERSCIVPKQKTIIDLVKDIWKQAYDSVSGVIIPCEFEDWVKQLRNPKTEDVELKAYRLAVEMTKKTKPLLVLGEYKTAWTLMVAEKCSIGTYNVEMLKAGDIIEYGKHAACRVVKVDIKVKTADVIRLQSWMGLKPKSVCDPDLIHNTTVVKENERNEDILSDLTKEFPSINDWFKHQLRTVLEQENVKVADQETEEIKNPKRVSPSKFNQKETKSSTNRERFYKSTEKFTFTVDDIEVGEEIPGTNQKKNLVVFPWKAIDLDKITADQVNKSAILKQLIKKGSLVPCTAEEAKQMEKKHEEEVTLSGNNSLGVFDKPVSEMFGKKLKENLDKVAEGIKKGKPVTSSYDNTPDPLVEEIDVDDSEPFTEEESNIATEIFEKSLRDRLKKKQQVKNKITMKDLLDTTKEVKISMKNKKTTGRDRKSALKSKKNKK